MRVDFDDNAPRCIRCNAKLENLEEVECHDVNDMVAMLRQCINRPGNITALNDFQAEMLSDSNLHQ